VISDPQRDPGRVIMVSVTTFEDYKEDVCPINAGDHPRVRLGSVRLGSARPVFVEAPFRVA
jgi:hypothetical protein